MELACEIYDEVLPERATAGYRDGVGAEGEWRTIDPGWPSGKGDIITVTCTKCTNGWWGLDTDDPTPCVWCDFGDALVELDQDPETQEIWHGDGGTVGWRHVGRIVS